MNADSFNNEDAILESIKYGEVGKELKPLFSF